MRHTDDQIREIFTNKLSEFESDVSPKLWESVSSQLGNASGVGVTTGVKIITGKSILAAAVALIGATALVAYLFVKNDEPQTKGAEKDVSEQRISQEPAPLNRPGAIIPGESDHSTENITSQQIIETNPDQKQSKETEYKIPSVKEKGLVTGEVQNGAQWSQPHQNVSNQNKQVEAIDHRQSSESKGNDVSPEKSDASDGSIVTGQFSLAIIDKTQLKYFCMPEDVKAANYFWDFGDGITSTEMNPAHSFSNEGEHTISLTVTSSDGQEKSSSRSIEIYIPGALLVPNVITPNGDGRNDFFDINEKSTNLTITKIVVMDAGGRLVFEGNGEILWDGLDKGGNICLAGTYEYYVSAIDRNHDILEKRGAVTLIR